MAASPLSFDPASRVFIDAAVKSAVSAVAKFDAWYAAVTGLFPSPMMQVQTTSGLHNLVLTDYWQRVGYNLRIPAQGVITHPLASFNIADIIAYKFVQGDKWMEIAPSALTLTDDVATGGVVGVVGNIDILMPDFGFDLGGSSPSPGPAPAPGPSPAPAPPPPPVDAPVPFNRPAGTYGALTFRDEFNGTSLNLTKWNIVADWQGNQPTYQELNNYAVANGYLEIWLRPNSDNQYWGWGRSINSRYKHEQKYGYFEARMILPWGAAAWPSFWLYGEDYVPHPEIDIIEAYPRGVPGPLDEGTNPKNNPFWNDGNAHSTSYASTIHYSSGSGASDTNFNSSGSIVTRSAGGNGWGAYLTNTLGDNTTLDTQYHHYGCLWEPSGITFFFDGVQMAPKRNTTLLSQLMFINPQMGPVSPYGQPSPYIDGTSPTTQGRGVKFDYVRAWALPYAGTQVVGTCPDPTSP